LKSVFKASLHHFCKEKLQFSALKPSDELEAFCFLQYNHSNMYKQNKEERELLEQKHKHTFHI